MCLHIRGAQAALRAASAWAMTWESNLLTKVNPYAAGLGRSPPPLRSIVPPAPKNLRGSQKAVCSCEKTHFPPLGQSLSTRIVPPEDTWGQTSYHRCAWMSILRLACDYKNQIPVIAGSRNLHLDRNVKRLQKAHSPLKAANSRMVSPKAAKSPLSLP